MAEDQDQDQDSPFGWRQRPDRRTSLLFDVFVLGQRTKALVEAAMKDAGLRPDEYAAYSVVFELGPITLTAIARELGMPITTVADHVRTMEARGHLRKAPHASDGRARALSLTASGLRAHRRASRAFDQAHRAMSSSMDLLEDEARATLRSLARSAEVGLASMSPAVRSARSTR